jgi:hypothetical protein
MHPLLETKLVALTQARLNFQKEFAHLSAEQCAKQPVDGWSIGQVIQHIMFSEGGTLGYMKKKSSSGWETLDVTGEEQVQNGMALNTRLQTNERYKAPAVLPEPENNIPIADALANWDRLRSDLVDFLESIEEVHFNKLVFRQPAAGMLNVIQTLDFLTNHLNHHIPQVQRIAREVTA